MEKFNDPLTLFSRALNVRQINIIIIIFLAIFGNSWDTLDVVVSYII